jgi:preprotein translocase subunit SecF
MNLFTRVYRGQTNFDFVGSARRTLVVSAIFVVLSLLLLLVRPLNLSIDFSGGTVVIVENQADASIEEVRAAMGDIGLSGARVQLTGEGFIRVQTEALPPDSQDALILSVAEVAGVDVNEVTVSAVGPTFGADVTRRALQALGIFLVVVSLFIAWRFEWKMAVAALVALFHDLAITGGIFALFQFTVSPATVIAILTIMGYSLYDTVVVFDKVDENVELMQDRSTYTAIVNTSMNQVLMRSINTSLTSLLPVGSLLLIGSFALGAATLREFALALFIGIALGTYSSLFVAAPVLAFWKEREEDWTRARRRADRRGSDEDTTTVVTVASGQLGATESGADELATEAEATEQKTSGATPRAPKKRKKRR